MTSVLVRKGKFANRHQHTEKAPVKTETVREDGPVKMEAEIRIRLRETTKNLGLLGTEGGKQMFTEASEGTWS